MHQPALRTTESASPPKPLALFLAYLVAFYAVWTLGWVYTLYPWANRELGDRTLVYALVSIGVRMIVWVVPVFAYLRFVDRVDALDYLQLRDRWLRGVLIGLALSVVNLALTTLRYGVPHLSSAYVTWNSIIGTSFLVGFIEEIPFRGFILQKLQERYDFATSCGISSLLFVGAHVPGWVKLGTLSAYNVGFIFVFGVSMAVVLRLSKSMWAPIVAHSLNDGMSNVLFHI